MKKQSFLKRLFSGVKFPYPCRLQTDHVAELRAARAQSREGDPLQIVHLSGEEWQGVFVYSVTLNRVLGRLTKHSEQQLVKALGKGFCVDGELYVWMKDGEDFRIELLVFPTQTLMNGEEISSLFGE